MTSDQCKDSGLAIILILLLTAWIADNNFFLGPAIVVLVLTMTIPKFFKPFAFIWFRFSHFLGGIVSKILLTGVFFILVTPVGEIRRLLGKDSMKTRNWKDNSESVFIDRSSTFDAEDLKRPF